MDSGKLRALKDARSSLDKIKLSLPDLEEPLKWNRFCCYDIMLWLEDSGPELMHNLRQFMFLSIPSQILDKKFCLWWDSLMQYLRIFGLLVFYRLRKLLRDHGGKRELQSSSLN